jgi:hydroxyacylglutathione hydrolase
MKVLMNTGGIAQTNCFVLADEESKQCVLFDAPDHTTAPLLDQIAQNGWTLLGLWLTHGHFDHMADHALVTQRFPQAKILLHPGDLTKVQQPDLQTRLFGLPWTIPPLLSPETITDGQTLHIGARPCRVIHTPGHSPGHVMYYFEQDKLLVGGDLIIAGSIGRTDLPDSNPRHMLESLKKAMALPDDTTLLPGHGEISTLGEERDENDVLQSVLDL